MPSFISTPILTDEQKAMANDLKEALALILEGKVSTYGIVLCLEDGPATKVGGRNAAALNIGLDHLKMQILNATFDSSEKKIESAAKIIKPRGH